MKRFLFRMLVRALDHLLSVRRVATIALASFSISWHLCAQVSLPYTTDFRADEGHNAGAPLAGDWATSSDSVIVTDQKAHSDNQSVFLPSETPEHIISLDFDPASSSVVFVQYYAQIGALSTLSLPLLTIPETSVALALRDAGASHGEWLALNGDGSGNGLWIPGGQLARLDADRQSTWHQVTLRLDLAANLWDIFIDGRLVQSNLGFAEAMTVSSEAILLYGNSLSPTYIDTFQIDTVNPLFTDADRDGMDDAYESANGLNVSLDDRNQDPDGDGLLNIEEYLLGFDPQDSSDAGLDVDGDGYSAFSEIALGLNPFVFSGPAQGRLLVQEWEGVGGSSVLDLTQTANFPGAPSVEYAVSSIDLVPNRKDNFGTRIQGYIVPEASGSYAFWIASDDSSEFWLSNNFEESNKSLVCSVTGSTGFQQWNALPSQQSIAVSLQAGEYYFFEVLHKEGGGNDHLSVAWTKPDSTFEIIPAAVFASVVPHDLDLDGLPDSFEQTIVDADAGDAFDSIVQVLPNGDFDGDGLTNLHELRFGSSAIIADIVYAAEANVEAVIEAEVYQAKVGRGAHGWQTESTLAGYLGSGYVQALPNSGTNQTIATYATNSPRLDYLVHFAEAGTYRVWVRGNAEGGDNNDSVHIGLNGVGTSSSERISLNASNDWLWAGKTMGGQNAAIEVTIPGIHVVNLWMREDGAAVDHLLVTQDTTYDPNVDWVPGVVVFDGFGDPYDQDEDGLLDTWEQAIIDADLSDNVATIEDVLPSDDFDADGFNNLDEFNNGTDPVTASACRYEAEDASYQGPSFRNGNAGYSGTGYLDYANVSNDYIEWAFESPASGTAELAIGYALGVGDRPLELRVNDVVEVSSLSFPATGGWTVWGEQVASVPVQEGINVVRATAIGSSGGNLDYLDVTLMLDASVQSDDDALDDAWEQQIIDADSNDAIETIQDVLPGDDFDGDQLTNEEEFILGLNPIVVDVLHVAAANSDAYIEAEAYQSKVDQDSKIWALETAFVGYVGSGYMRALPNTGSTNNTSIYTTNSPRMDYLVRFEEAGTYRVWVRGHSQASNVDDSLHLGINGIGSDASERVSLVNDTTWQWTNHTMDGAVVQIVVDAPGLHWINLWMREDGAAVDQIVLTQDSAFDPSGAPDDSDGDELLDAWEQAIIDADPNDAITTFDDVLVGDDFDGDGLTNLEEYTLNLSPIVVDLLHVLSVDNEVTIEAEQYHSKVDHAGKSWELEDGLAGYIGNGYMRALPNTGSANTVDNYVANSPRMDYLVRFASAGTYRIWVRGHSQGSNTDDSLHIGINGSGSVVSERVSLINDNSWQWTNRTMGGAYVELTVDIAGLHWINVWMREDGAAIDQFILTHDWVFDPSINPDDLDDDGLLDAWEQGIIDADLNDELVVVEDVLPTADFDFDGLSNREEFDNHTDPVRASSTRHEAEAAVFMGPDVKFNNSGYSGTGYLDYVNTSGDYIEWSFLSPSTGWARISFAYALGFGDRPLELRINGIVQQGSFSFPTSGGWAEWEQRSAIIPIAAGANTVRITAIGSSGGNFDYLDVTRFLDDSWAVRIVNADTTDGITSVDQVLPYADFDGDGLANIVEFVNGLDPTVDDSLLDLDGDRFPNQWEVWAGTNANDSSEYPRRVGPLSEYGAPAGVELYSVDLSLLDDSLPFKKKTIQAAINSLNDHDILAIMPGTYHAPVSLPNYLDDVAIVAMDQEAFGEQVVIDVRHTSDYAVKVNGPAAASPIPYSTLIIDGLVMQNANDAAFIAYGLWGSIRNCVFRSSTRGVRLKHVGELEFENSTIYGNSGVNAAFVSDGAQFSAKLNLRNCSIFDNIDTSGEGVVHITGGGYGQYSLTTYIKNSLFWNENNSFQFGAEGASRIRLSDNLIHGGVGAFYTAGGGSITSSGLLLDEDPLLTVDGHLQSNSPAINRGNSAVATSRDRDSEARFGEMIDLGSDEFVDTDRDFLPDFLEQMVTQQRQDPLGSSPAVDDLIDDSDDLNLLFEYVYGTNPLLVDTDGDGVNDDLELHNGSDPLIGNYWIDSDGDRFPNQWELWAGTDASDPTSYPKEEDVGVLTYGDAPSNVEMYLVDSSLPDNSLTYRKKTIQAALNAMDDGDILAIKPSAVPYLGPIHVSMSATDYFAIVALDGGIGSGNVAIDLDGLINEDTFEVSGQGVLSSNPLSAFIIIDGLLLEGATAAGSAAFTIRQGRGFIRNCIFRDSRQGIFINQSTALSCIFDNCVVSGNSGSSGISAVEIGTGSTTFRNCTFFGNRKGNSSQGAEMFRFSRGAVVRFRNSIIWNESDSVHEMSIEGGRTYFSDTILRGGTSALRLAGGAYQLITPLITDNPLLDAMGRPQIGSPAIGHSSLSTRAPVNDIEGALRYVDLPDLGAYEVADGLSNSFTDGEVQIVVDGSTDPATATLSAAETSLFDGARIQIYWDLDGNGDFDVQGGSLTRSLPALLGETVDVRFLSSQGDELVKTIDFRDLNGNGVPDYWDTQYFPNGGSLLTDDPDLDGADNLSEFLSNTNPLDNSDAGLNLVIYNL